MKRPREGDTVKAIMDYLELRGILALRLNSGDFFVRSAKGKGYRIRGQKAGTADILCFPNTKTWRYPSRIDLWIETKRAEVGKQSLEQKQFQQRVEELGHVYILARSLDDVIKVVG